jgi:hypothetical protein
MLCATCIVMLYYETSFWEPESLILINVPSSNIGPETGYPDRLGFPQSLQANVEIVS